jgi:flagellar motor switch protein FliM
LETGILEGIGTAPTGSEPATIARPAPVQAEAPAARSDDRPWFELRRSDILTTDQVGIIRELHRGFAREVGRRAGNALRTLVRVSASDAQQRPYRSFAAGMPPPCIVAPVILDPLPGALVVAIPGATALCLVDRLMGGDGRSCPARVPTDLEMLVVADFLQLLLPPLTEAFEPVVAIRPSLTAIETNPALLRVIPGAEMTLALPQVLAFPGAPMPPAVLSLCYPVTMLRAAFELLDPGAGPEPLVDLPFPAGISSQLGHVGVDLSVHLKPSPVPAGDIVGLRVGDVIRLDHKTDEPALGAVRGVDLFSGSVGTRGGHLGFRVTSWRNDE